MLTFNLGFSSAGSGKTLDDLAHRAGEADEREVCRRFGLEKSGLVQKCFAAEKDIAVARAEARPRRNSRQNRFFLRVERRGVQKCALELLDLRPVDGGFHDQKAV